MAKTNEYKQMKVFMTRQGQTGTTDEIVELKDLLSGAVKYWSGDNDIFYVEFVLKRRQIKESYQNQIHRAMAGNLASLNTALTSKGMIPFDYDTLAESFVFSDTDLGDNVIRLVVWNEESRKKLQN